MKKVIYLFTAAAVLLSGCNDKDPVKPEVKHLMEVTGSIDGAAALEKDKAFFLYALLSPGEDWEAFYINKDNALLGTDGDVKTGKEYYWPLDDNMYRFIGIMNSADQSQPIVNMDGPVIGLSAGDTPASDLLLSNNLMMRRTSVADKMEFRHVMTQVVFEMVIDDDNDEAYSLSGKTVAGKQSATYSALALPKIDVATLADDAVDYVAELELASTETDRSPRSVYYLIPDGSDLTALTDIKVNGNDDVDIDLVTADGKPVTLRSGDSYLVQLHITKGVVKAIVSVGTWLEQNLGDQSADIALSDVKWAVSYPEGFASISKVEIIDNSNKSYFAPLDANGNTMSPADMPSVYKELAVWLDNLRVVLREGEYTLEDNKLDINHVYVGTPEKLAAISTDAATLAYSYRQAAHIDLGEGHTPVGNTDAPFTGVYDGAGYRITNMKFAAPGINSGLFGVNSGTIKNVIIAKTVIEDLRDTNGVICAVNNAAGTIESCENHATFKSNQTDVASTKIGGIVGSNSGTIRDCVNYGEGHSLYDYLGGICGINNIGGTLSYCENYGKISMTGSAGNYTGGITGSTGSNSNSEYCTNYGAISGRGYVGGIAGISYASMKSQTNYGDITATDTRSGGITGHLQTAGSTLSECINNGNINGTTYVGGIAGTSRTTTNVLNSANTGKVTGSAAAVGGIVGYVDASCKIDKNINKGAVTNNGTTGALNTGGIAGYVANSNLTENVNTGSVTGLVTGTGEHIAGIVGNYTGGTLLRNINTGTITAPKYACGIVSGSPTVADTKIVACVNSGAVTATTSGYAAGVLGRVPPNVEIIACYNEGSITGSTMTGGIGGWTSGKITACYSVGSIIRNAGTSTRLGGICGYLDTSPITACYWAGSVFTNTGTGAIVGGQTSEANPFTETAWPTEETNAGWKLTTNGGYWESLGHWDAANPEYPTLAGLPEVPAP